MKMEKTKKINLIKSHKECKSWFLEIENWKKNIQFMKSLMIRFSPTLEDKNSVIELRTFYNDLDDSFKNRIDWLAEKLVVYQTSLQSFFKEDRLLELSDIQTEHKIFQREISQLRGEYQSVRDSFFNLIKPTLRKRKLVKQSIKAA